MSYYDIHIKQLLSDKTDKLVVVYDPETETEWAQEVVFFALCDLYERASQDEDARHLETYIGVILPVVFDESEGLVPELLSDYKLPSEQKVRLRKLS